MKTIEAILFLFVSFAHPFVYSLCISSDLSFSFSTSTLVDIHSFNKVVYPCWNISPKKRPTFSMINSHLHQFKNGSDEGASYYAPGEGGSGSGGSGGYYDSSGAGRASMYPGQQQQLYHDARQIR